MDQRFWGPGPSEPSQTDVGLSCSQPDVKVCEHGHQYWRQFHASLTLWLSNSLLILVDRDTAEGIPAISPSSWYFIRFFLSLFVISLCHILKLKKKTQVWNRHSWKENWALLFIYGGKTKGSKNTIERKQPFSVWFVIGQKDRLVLGGAVFRGYMDVWPGNVPQQQHTDKTGNFVNFWSPSSLFLKIWQHFNVFLKCHSLFLSNSTRNNISKRQVHIWPQSVDPPHPPSSPSRCKTTQSNPVIVNLLLLTLVMTNLVQDCN